MSKTTELRKIVTTELRKACNNIYYQRADVNAAYPYIVYTFQTTVMLEARNDVQLIVDIWDKTSNTTNLEVITDEIESILNYANLPQLNSLPTIFLDLRNSIEDDDPTIQHRQLRFTIQNYYKGE